MTDYTFNLPVKSEQLEAIGMVATEWAYLESVVEAAIWQLANLNPDQGEAITTHLGMPLRLDMLLTLFRLHYSDNAEAKELEKLCEPIRHELSRKRGEAIHTRWVRGEHDSPMIYAVRARGKLERERRGQPAKKIREIAAAIAAQAEALRDFLGQRGIVEVTP